MHLSSVELRGASPTQRTRAAGPGPGRARGRGLPPPEGVRLWAGLLLWALVAPGACGLTADMVDTIVELHNFYRGQVFPTATAMMPLGALNRKLIPLKRKQLSQSGEGPLVLGSKVTSGPIRGADIKWDPSLQVLAGGYVAQCTWQHNPLLSDTGENLFVTEGTLDIQVALEQWFMEHLNYHYDNNSCPEDKMCGHYTQMVWADSHRVGCELHSCDVMQGLEIGPSQFLVCNYYPAGNYDDQKPYEEGDWCSRCPEDLQKCENHLCVPDVEEEEEDEDHEDSTLSLYTTEPPIASFPFGSTEAPPPTPSEDTPPPLEGTPPTPSEDTPPPSEDTPPPSEDTPPPSEDTPPATDSSPDNVELPAHLEEETVEEVLKEEEEQVENEQKEEEPKEDETVEEEQKEAEQQDEEQKEEEPKQTKLLIETRWEKTREAPISSRSTSCCAYDNFLLLCLVGALVLRL